MPQEPAQSITWQNLFFGSMMLNSSYPKLHLRIFTDVRASLRVFNRSFPYPISISIPIVSFELPSTVRFSNMRRVMFTSSDEVNITRLIFENRTVEGSSKETIGIEIEMGYGNDLLNTRREARTSVNIRR